MEPKIKNDVARRIQHDLPVERRPFDSIGKAVHLSEDDVIALVKDLRREGVIRKFGAILAHRKAGVTQNAMVVWAVSPLQCDEAGRALALHKEVSHCYERTPPFLGKYTLFTMIHAGRGDLDRVVKTIAASAGIDDYLILETVQEYKKSSMEYFKDEKNGDSAHP